MALQFETLRDLIENGFDTVIDVRAPSEFAEDHIPGAINLPVLNDAERARVGTIYKQESPFRARKVGAALVARNAARHIEGPLAQNDGGWRPLVYCWRGGQRSGSFASILSDIGWRTETIQGGYKSYRRMVVSALYDNPPPARVVLLDGFTGTGKTEVLGRLPALGIQVIDLEGLAGHRGSVLGAMGPQPSQKAFETSLAGALCRLDPARPVVIEAESAKIGRLILPPKLFEAMRAAPRIELAAPLATRADYLAGIYGADRDALADRVQALLPLRGANRVAIWDKMIRAGALEEAATQLMATHYDQAYTKSRARSGGQVLARVEAATLDASGLDRVAARVAEALNEV